MDSSRSFSDTARSLLSAVALLCALGAPSVGRSSNTQCPSSLATAQLAVKATGIESPGRWALISYQEEDLLVDEGASLGRCFELSRVKNSSVIVKLRETGEEREFFFGGFSSAPVPERMDVIPPGDGLIRAVADHQVVPVSEHVVKIQYPMYSNNNTLPQTIYRNARGDALFEDLNQLGLGKDSAAGVDGVRVGDNTADSVLGSLGISEGDHIVAINGVFVNSPEQVGRFLKEFSGAPIQIGYTRGDDAAIYSTATMIQAG